jgi:hypothetical protein
LGGGREGEIEVAACAGGDAFAAGRAHAVSNCGLLGGLGGVGGRNGEERLVGGARESW